MKLLPQFYLAGYLSKEAGPGGDYPLDHVSPVEAATMAAPLTAAAAGAGAVGGAGIGAAVGGLVGENQTAKARIRRALIGALLGGAAGGIAVPAAGAIGLSHLANREHERRKPLAGVRSLF